MFIQNIDPVLFHIGIFEIRYYGIIFASGFIAAYFFLKYLSKRKKMDLSSDDIADYLTYLIIGSVVGARLFEVLVYEPSYYFSNPSQVLAVWKGGLSIHGGIIGAMIAGYFFTRKEGMKKKKITFWKLADISMMPLSFALIFGRLANFTNSEFIGRITDVPWAVKFMRADTEYFRHPVQIYEAIKNAAIFIILLAADSINQDKTHINHKKKRKDGYLFWLFIFLYSILRFFIEFYKEWSTYYFGLSLPQIISIPFIILAGIMLFKTK